MTSRIVGALRVDLSAGLAEFAEDMDGAGGVLDKFSRKAMNVGATIAKVGAGMTVALTTPFILFSKKAIDAGIAGTQAMGQVEAALKSTGNQAGKTGEQLQAAAKVLEKGSNFGNTEILSGLTAELLKFGNVQGAIFDRAQQDIVDFATRMKTDLPTATKLVGLALEDPIKGLNQLHRAGITFSDDEQKMIKSLVQSGKGFEAQKIILGELEKQFGGAGQAMKDATPGRDAGQAWDNFLETIGKIEMTALPALTSALTSVFEWFEKLTPSTQKWVVIGVALVAALGPVVALVGSLITVGAALIPVLGAIAVAMAGITLPVWGIIAAITAVIALIAIFRKSVVDVLHGDFTKAWKDAKQAASDAVDFIAKKIKSLNATPIEVRGTSSKGKHGGGSAAGGAGNPGATGSGDFALHNEADLAKQAAAAKSLNEEIGNMQIRLQKGLDDLNLPKSTAQANQLTAQLDQYVQRAKDAGVNTGAFANKIAELKTRIADLQKQGLQDEADKFAIVVAKDAVAVDKLTNGGLSPLQEKLQNVDDSFESLKQQLEDQIKDYAVLAATNDTARGAMEKLEATLDGLAAKHDKATAAAKRQYEQEQAIADAQSKISQLDTSTQIRDLQQASGKANAPIGQNAQDLQNINDDLKKQQLETAEHLTELEKARDDAAEKHDQVAVDNLNSEIDLQKQLYDLVSSTTGEEIQAAQKRNAAWSDFSDDISKAFSDMAMKGKFSISSLGDALNSLTQKLFVQPGTDMLGNLISGAGKDLFGGIGGGSAAGSAGGSSMFSGIGDLFSGFFDGGGRINPGQWGVVGEFGPEIVGAGAHPAHVMSRDDTLARAGGGITMNFTTPDADSFRRSTRQTARAAKQMLGNT